MPETSDLEVELIHLNERRRWDQHAARLAQARLAVAEMALRKIRDCETLAEAQEWTTDAIRRIDDMTRGYDDMTHDPA